MTSDSAPDHQLLRSYLLGVTDEEATEQFDERSVTDEGFALLLRSAEYDLADAYVDGTLSGAERDAFRSRYLASPEGRANVRFAEALAAHREPGRSRALPVLAAAATLLLSTSVYLGSENLRLRRDIEAVRAEAANRAAGEPRRQPPIDDGRSAAAAGSRGELAAASTTPRVIAAFVLSPAIRGADAPPTIALPSGTDAVRLQLPLETDAAPSFDAVVQTDANQIVWRGTDLHAAATTSGSAVTVTIPALVLNPSDYRVELRAVRDGRRPESPVDYPFRVVTP